MKVYLAGPSKELPRVKAWAEKLESAGHTITYKWWVDVEKHGPGNDGGLGDHDQQRYANADLDGVSEADVVWLLWPEAGSMGTAVELGYALAVRDDQSAERLVANIVTYVVVTGAKAQACIFAALANLRHTDDEAGFAYVAKLAQRKGSAAP